MSYLNCGVDESEEWSSQLIFQFKQSERSLISVVSPLVGRVNNFSVHQSHWVLVLLQSHDDDELIFDPIINEILEQYEASKERTKEPS